VTAPEVLAETAYCGLSCAVCSHLVEGCAGCRSGGGPDRCFKRECAQEQNLEGCWDCERFPCAPGFQAEEADEAWRGLTEGCCQVIRERGVETFLRLIRAKLGENYDYGYLRFKSPEEIVELLK